MRQGESYSAHVNDRYQYEALRYRRTYSADPRANTVKAGYERHLTET